MSVVAVKFAGWNVDGPLPMSNRAQSVRPSTGLRPNSNRQLILFARTSEGSSWFTLAMLCPYIAVATGASRDVPCEVAGQFEGKEDPADIFETLRNEVHRWLETKVSLTFEGAD